MGRERLRPGEIGKVTAKKIRANAWQADGSFRDHTGALGRSRKIGRTKTEARHLVIEEIEEILRYADARGLVQRTTLVSEAVEIYLTNRMTDARNGIGQANPRSVRQYRSTAENWVVDPLGDLQVRDLTAGRLDAYFRSDVPTSRYSDVRKMLSGFVKWLVVQGALRSNPIENLQSYRRRDQEKRSKDRDVTPDDLAAVIAAIEVWMTAARPGPKASPLYRDLVLLVAATACRPGEALAVRCCDIDLEFEIEPGVVKPVVKLTGTIVYDAEMGGLYRQPYTKGEGVGDRIVVLPEFVLPLLRRRIMAAKADDEAPIFATRTGGWLSLNNINTRFRETILKGTAVAEWFELRQLRSATGTTIATKHGAEAAAAQMGNTREVAEAHYIHKRLLVPDRSAEIQQAWGSILE